MEQKRKETFRASVSQKGDVIMAGRRRARFEFKGVKGAIIFVVLAAMLLAYYFYLSNHSKAMKAGTTQDTITPVQNVLLRNLEADYPPTPKEVVKYYSELTQCLYNEELSDKEIEQLGERARELYDEELNENNEEGQYLMDLRADIESFNNQSIRISSYALPASTDVDYFTEGGRECAKIYCTYSIRQESNLTYSRELFVLRKADDGRWKILGWDLAPDEAQQ